MKRISLNVGDTVILTKYIKHKKASLQRYLVVNKETSFPGKVVFYNSILHQYLETLGINPSVAQRKAALSKLTKLQRRNYKSVELLEIERTTKWYTSILHRLAFWKKGMK